MLSKAWAPLRRRPVRGLAISLALHGLVVALMLLLALPAAQYTGKRGEPLFIELPELPEPPPRGNPAAKSLAPPRPETPTAAKRTPPAPPAKPAPPTPSPSPSPVLASRPATPPPPPSPDLPLPDAGELPKPAPKHETPPPESAPPGPPAVGAAPGPQVASVPPSRELAPPVDIRSALGRDGGAGAVHGGGWGGITGEPVSLDSPDPRFRDYLERVRRQIQAKMVYPCIKNSATFECDYKTTSLVVYFGILKNGNLQVVELVQPSEWSIYDDYSMNAIKLAQPFPPLPPAIVAALEPGSAGMPIKAHFVYTVYTTLRSILR